MSKAPSYWSLAARTLPPAEPILIPSPILFRQENGPPVSDEVATDNPTATTRLVARSPAVNEASLLPMVIESTRDRDQVPTLSNKPDRDRESTFSAPTSIAMTQTDQRLPIEVQRSDLETQPDHFPLPSLNEFTQERSDSTQILKPPAKLSVSAKSDELPVPVSQSERSIESNPVGREYLASAAAMRDETEQALAVQISKSTSKSTETTSESASESAIESRGKQETLPRLQPPVMHADTQSAALVDKSAREESISEISTSNVPPIHASQADENKLRIGSIVVHIEKPSPQAAQRPTAPTAVKPSGTLSRSFSNFGFHQN